MTDLTKICPNCSNLTDMDTKFCGYCGAVFGEKSENQKEDLVQMIEQEQIAPIEKGDNLLSIPEPINSEMSFIQLYFSPKGRIGLNTFWKKGILPLGAIFVLMLIVSGGLGNSYSQNNALGLVCIGVPLFILYLYADLMIMIKRLHDINRSGWTYFNPFLSLWLFKDIYLSKGTPGSNKYGDYSY
ncbi:MAG: zinc-ribbon domain-containing protein [Bellilinea sp.]